MRRLFLIALGCLCLVSAEGRADEASLTNQTTVLPEVIVTGKEPGTGSLTSPSLAQAEELKQAVPGGFTVQTTDSMNHGRASGLQDFLQDVPGVLLQSDNNVEATRISIRGSGVLSEDEPLGVQFLLDGLTLNQGDGEALLEDVDLATVRYAEVYRGANAFQYGSITLGGAINFVPITGYDADRFGVSLEGGSYDYFRGQLISGGVAGPFDYVASVMGRTSDGFRDHSREDTERFFGNLGWRISDHAENRLYVTLGRVDRDLPGGLTKQELNDKPQQANDDAVEQDFNKNWTLIRVADKFSARTADQELDAGLVWFFRSMEERDLFEPDYRLGITRFYSHNVGALVRHVTHGEWREHRNEFTIGLCPQFEIETTQNYENLDGKAGRTTARDQGISVNAPLYMQNQFYFTDNLSGVAGLQWIFAERHFHDRFYKDDEGNQSHVNYFYTVNPKLGWIYEYDAKGQIYGNVSRSWQPPSFDNMVEFEEGLNSSVVYTPLTPQHAWTVELGARGERGRFEWELSLYQSWVRNELLELNDALGNDIGAVNVDRSDHRGIEAGLDVTLLESIVCQKTGARAGDRLSLRQGYTLTDLKFDNDPVYGSHRIAGIPIHLYRAELMYDAPGGFYAGPNLTWNLTPYPVDQANTLFADAYALLGFKIGYRKKKGFSLFFEAKNLTNERYASSVDPIADARTAAPDDTTVFHPGDGRSFYGGVSWSW